MLKEELRQRLGRGQVLIELLDMSLGEDGGIIFKKEPGKENGEVVYIPDLMVNDIPLHDAVPIRDIEDVMHDIYTWQDIIDECHGNIRLARDVFTNINWQHPSTEVSDLFACSDQAEAVGSWGQDENAFDPKSAPATNYWLVGTSGKGLLVKVAPVRSIEDAEYLLGSVARYLAKPGETIVPDPYCETGLLTDLRVVHSNNLENQIV